MDIPKNNEPVWVKLSNKSLYDDRTWLLRYSTGVINDDGLICYDGQRKGPKLGCIKSQLPLFATPWKKWMKFDVNNLPQNEI